MSTVSRSRNPAIAKPPKIPKQADQESSPRAKTDEEPVVKATTQGPDTFYQNALQQRLTQIVPSEQRSYIGKRVTVLYADKYDSSRKFTATGRIERITKTSVLLNLGLGHDLWLPHSYAAPAIFFLLPNDT